MNTTLFLAQIWGPILLAIGFGFFISRSFYVRLYKDIQNEPLATLVFGMFAMTVGILQIFVHNSWGSFNAGLMSFLGWATLIKGAMFLIVPGFVDKAADWEVSKKFVPVAGLLVIIAGIYLSWIGYLG